MDITTATQVHGYDAQRGDVTLVDGELLPVVERTRATVTVDTGIALRGACHAPGATRTLTFLAGEARTYYRAA